MLHGKAPILSCIASLKDVGSAAKKLDEKLKTYHKKHYLKEDVPWKKFDWEQVLHGRWRVAM